MMRFMRAAAAVLLLAVLCVPVHGAGFERNQSCPSFADVETNAWYADNVKAVCEFGLMEGKSASSFDPEGNMTTAEAVTVAARLHARWFGEEIPDDPEAEAWYDRYVRYAADRGICDFRAKTGLDMAAQANRRLFAHLTANALPDEALTKINRIDDGSLTDVSPQWDWGEAVYRLYRAGILTGSSADGRTFDPSSPIRRSEVAAILSRTADPALRKNLTLLSDGTVTLRLEENTGRHGAETVIETRSEVVGLSGWYRSDSPATLTETILSVRLSDEAKAAYPALAAAVDALNADLLAMGEGHIAEFKRMYPTETDQWQNFGVSYGVVSRFTDHVLSIWYVNGGFRSGAAHGFDELCTANFDPETGRELTLADVLESVKAFRAALKEKFSGLNESVNGSFIGDLDEDQMPEPTAWYLTDGGLTVEFRQFNYSSYIGLMFTLPENLLKPEYRSGTELAEPFTEIQSVPNPATGGTRYEIVPAGRGTTPGDGFRVSYDTEVRTLNIDGTPYAFADDRVNRKILVFTRLTDGSLFLWDTFLYSRGEWNTESIRYPSDLSELVR